MAITAAVGAFCGSLLTRYVPVALLLSFIGVKVSYELIVLEPIPKILTSYAFLFDQ